MNREILFPTPVYFKMVKDPQKLNKYLFPLIKAWSKKDKGEEKTNAGGGWHSPIDMNHKKEYQPLTDELFIMQEEIFKDYGIKFKSNSFIGKANHIYSHFSIEQHGYKCDYLSGDLISDYHSDYKWISQGDEVLFPIHKASNKLLIKLKV